MKIIIDIPENLYNFVNTKRPNGYYNEFDKFDTYDVSKAIRNGIPLPKGHGDLIDSNILCEQYEKTYGDFYQALDLTPIIIEADEGE